MYVPELHLWKSVARPCWARDGHTTVEINLITTDAISNGLLSYMKGCFSVKRRARRQRSGLQLTVSHKLYRQTTLLLLDTDSVLQCSWIGLQQSRTNCWWTKIPSFPHDRKQMGVASIHFCSAHKIREVKASRNEGTTHYRKHRIKQDPLIQKRQDQISLKILN